MVDATGYSIRPATPSDEPFLWEMLYQSLFVEEGREPHPREVLQLPNIARYVKGWGREGDLGFVALDTESGRPVGAAWCRLSEGDDKGFAYLDDETPELGVAVLPEHRGKGVGTALLRRLLAEAAERFKAVSLSVSPNNPAVRLYERLGFRTVDVRGDDHPVMRIELPPRR